MKYYILALILFLTRLAGFAQQVLLADSITKNPICYATVYDANGTVIGRSDMGGFIHLQKGFEYHISHISYEPKSLVAYLVNAFDTNKNDYKNKLIQDLGINIGVCFQIKGW